MAQYVKVGGTWRTVDTSTCGSVKVGGVWKSVSNGYVKVGGVWKEYCAPPVTTTTTATTATTTATTSSTTATTSPVTTSSTTSTTTSTTTTTTTTTTPSISGLSLLKCANSICCCDRIDVSWNSQYQNSYRVTDSTGFNSGVIYGATTFYAIGKTCGQTYSNLSVTVTIWSTGDGTGTSASTSGSGTFTMEACPATTTSTSVTSTLPVTSTTTTSSTAATTATTSSSSGPCPAGQTPVYGSVCSGFYASDPIIGCGGPGACTFGSEYPVSCFIFCCC